MHRLPVRKMQRVGRAIDLKIARTVGVNPPLRSERRRLLIADVLEFLAILEKLIEPTSYPDFLKLRIPWTENGGFGTIGGIMPDFDPLTTRFSARNALLLAQLCSAAYADESEAKSTTENLEFTDFRWVELTSHFNEDVYAI